MFRFDRMGYKVGHELQSTTRWFTKYARDYKLREDDKKRRYKASCIYTLSHSKVYYFKIYSVKKVFLMIFLSEYIIADMIRDIFMYTFLINILLSFLQYHTNKNSSFKNS